MAKKGETKFSDVSMFSLNNSILVVNVWTDDAMSDAKVIKKRG